MSFTAAISPAKAPTGSPWRLRCGSGTTDSAPPRLKLHGSAVFDPFPSPLPIGSLNTTEQVETSMAQRASPGVDLPHRPLPHWRHLAPLAPTCARGRGQDRTRAPISPKHARRFGRARWRRRIGTPKPARAFHILQAGNQKNLLATALLTLTLTDSLRPTDSITSTAIASSKGEGLALSAGEITHWLERRRAPVT